MVDGAQIHLKIPQRPVDIGQPRVVSSVGRVLRHVIDVFCRSCPTARDGRVPARRRGGAQDCNHDEKSVGFAHSYTIDARYEPWVSRVLGDC